MIITLCGSSRFEDWFHVYNRVLSRAGHLVFDMSCHQSTIDRLPFLRLKKPTNKHVAMSIDDKAIADDVHKEKIRASNAVLVLNAFAYIGESTLEEIHFAEGEGKTIFFLESWGRGCGIGESHGQSIRRAARTYDVHGGSPIDTFYQHAKFGKDIYGTFDGLPVLGEGGSPTRIACLDIIEKFKERLQERFE